MVLPEGVPKANTIVKLKKAPYGLKTAPRLWHKTINAFLLSLESMQSEADPNLYIRRNLKAMQDMAEAMHSISSYMSMTCRSSTLEPPLPLPRTSKQSF